MLELLARDQFRDAIQDGDMWLQLRLAHPKSLRETLQLALELEAFQLASQCQAKPVRDATLDKDEQQANNPPRMAFSREDLTKCIQQYVKTVCDKLQSKKKPGQREKKPSSGQQKSFRGNCWTCGKQGHMRIHCSELQASGELRMFSRPELD